MCFIVSVILLVLSFNFYNSGSLLLAIGSFAISAFFIFLMIKNIQAVKKLRDEKKRLKNDN